jgi:hypothetical protein
MRSVLYLIAAACLSLPATAQTRTEQQIQDLNRSVETQQRQRNSEQQRQIDTNQQRQSVDRQRNLPSTTGSTGNRICAPGQIGC